MHKNDSVPKDAVPVTSSPVTSSMDALVATSSSRSGDLDLTFGEGGKVIRSYGIEGVQAIAIQADGKIVIAGFASVGSGPSGPRIGMLVGRYNPDGSMDHSFGTEGVGNISFDDRDIRAVALALQPDKKILVAGQDITDGSVGSNFIVVRLDHNGERDFTLGEGGIVGTNFTEDYAELGYVSHDTVNALALDPYGKIVAAGITVTPPSERNTIATAQFALARYHSDGTLDTTFGISWGHAMAGTVTATFTAGFDGAQAVAVQPDGMIVAAGGTAMDRGFSDFGLVRYKRDGALDPSFGNGGKVTTDFGATNDIAFALVIQPDDSILAAGVTGNQQNTDFALARYNPDGSLDASFGNAGKVITDFGGPSDGAFALALQIDSKIVVAGVTGNINSTTDFALARYNPDGSLDSSFGNAGKVITNLGGDIDAGRALALHSDGKIFVAGTSASNSPAGATFNSAIACYQNPPAQSSPETAPILPGGDLQAAVKEPDYRSGGDTRKPGDLDPTFGVQGKVVTDFRAKGPCTLAIQSDGKIVVAGSSDSPDGPYQTRVDLALIRYNSDGSLDAAFGSGGGQTFDSGEAYDEKAHALALQADGKILVGGEKNGQWIIVRFDQDGEPDATFGNDGLVTTYFSGDEWADNVFASLYSLAIDASGNILGGGHLKNFNRPQTEDFALARYDPDGELDASFGSSGTGKVITDFAGGFDKAQAVAVQPDGKIVVAGKTEGNFGLTRYDQNGLLDPSFGNGGKVTTKSGHDGLANALLIQPDRKIVAAGSNMLVRYNSDGSLDLSFGTGGIVTTFGDNSYAATLQDDGKIIVVGYSKSNFTKQSNDFALSRYNPDGSLDATFGDNGVIITDFGGGYDVAYGVALQPDGNIVVAGTSGADFAVARYLNDS